jgi:voltage-gated potassium channel
VGDPGNFADTPPVTLAGRLIACIIGLLGIALFAVPAGLIGAGFSEAMAEEKQHRAIMRLLPPNRDFGNWVFPKTRYASERAR